MVKTTLLSDPDLEVIVIDDFTPGIQRFSRGGYSPTFPLVRGSASSSFRCYAQPEVGLCPFPQYAATAFANNSTNTYTAITGMTSLGAGAFGLGEFLVVGSQKFNGTALSTFTLTAVVNPIVTSPLVLSTVAYTSTYAGDAGMVFNNLSSWFTVAAGPIYNVVAFSIDPLNVVANQLKWVTVPSWNSNANSLTGTVAIPSGATPLTVGPTFVSSSRAGILGSLATEPSPGNIGPGFNHGVWLSDIQAPTNITGPSFFAPSNSNFIGSWGSVSTGEFFIVFQGQGGAIIYGDVSFPTSVLNLPGVIGTGKAIGPAAPTSMGLVYPTDTAGVYVWNGSNTAEKISTQIPDDQVIRSQYTADLFNASAFAPCLTHHDVWNNWVMFANNWMYDIETNSWWQVEDPSIHNFQVHTGSHFSPRFFYSADGYVTALNAILNVYMWDSTLPSTSYTWTSNPIGNPGSRMSLQTVEIVASNPTATTATITVSPTSPVGQSLYGNQNNTQPAIFTIPPLTSGFRSSLRLGYTDYNVCITILAQNSSTNGAPILHELSLGVSYRSSAGA